jgi:SOS-response transcriptional repressor LexA
MSHKLTPKQQKILDYMQVFFESNQAMPTMQSITQAFGYASTNAAQEHIDRLVKKGHLHYGTDDQEPIPTKQRGAFRKSDTRPQAPNLRFTNFQPTLIPAGSSIAALHPRHTTDRLIATRFQAALTAQELKESHHA